MRPFYLNDFVVESCAMITAYSLGRFFMLLKYDRCGAHKLPEVVAVEAAYLQFTLFLKQLLKRK